MQIIFLNLLHQIVTKLTNSPHHITLSIKTEKQDEVLPSFVLI